MKKESVLVKIIGLWLLVFWFSLIFVSEARAEPKTKILCKDDTSYYVFSGLEGITITYNVNNYDDYCHAESSKTFCKDIWEFMQRKIKEMQDEILASGECKKVDFD